MRYTSALHFALAVIVTSTPVQAKIINVPADSTTIQAAINGASNGDTVLVQPGTYVENINFNGKDIIVGSLLITTDDTSYIRQTVIDGGQSDRVVTMNMGETSSASLVGLTIQNGSKWWGAGILCDNSSSPSLDHLSVINNSVEGGVNGTGGGGICCLNNSNPSISNSVISHNTVTPWDGGGIFTHNSSPTISNTIIYGNVAEREGGAIFVGGSSNPILSDVLVYSNSGLTGGGLYFGGANGTLMNMTIHDNYSQNGGGIVINDGGDPVIVNTILWDNEPNQIFFHIGFPSSFSIAYSNVAGGLANIGNPGNGTVNWLEGNIDSTPFFNSHETGDYSLLDYSPCIGSGIDSIQIDGSWYYAPSTDIESNTRPNPPGSNPDMGAYENSRAIALPRIEIVPSSIAFGSIRIGTTSSDTLLVMSVSTGETLEVSSISSSNPAFTASPSSFSVLPGDSATVVVTFSPTDMVTYTDSLTIYSNDPQQPEVKVYLSGSGNPILAVSPAQNALNVPLETTISVTFGVDISSSTIDANTFVVHGSYTGKLGGTYSYESDTKTATFVPDQYFKVGEKVSTVITSGLETIYGESLLNPYQWIFTIEVLPGSGVFDEVANYTSRYSPWSVASSDFNSDSYADLVITNAASSSVTVLLGVGDGTFIIKSNFSTGSNPHGLVVADFDSDGKADVVTANQGYDNISHFSGRGDGVFVNEIRYNTGHRPSGLVSADLNNDGHYDLVVTNESDDNISVFLNNGDGTFMTRSNYITGNTPVGVTSGDLDNDGIMDLAVVDIASDSISVLRGRGDGTFSTRVGFPVGNNPRSVEACDLDLDTDVDLVVTNSSDSTVSVMFNNGHGSFGTITNYSSGKSPISTSLSDINGDGLPDIIVANQEGTVSVILNDTSGVFREKRDFTSGLAPTSVVSMDLNMDGILDLAVTNYGHDNISVLLNKEIFSCRLMLNTWAEQTDTVGISYMIINPDSNTTSLYCEYSNDRITWHQATIISDTSNLAPEQYAGIVQWDSYADLPGVDHNSTFFKIAPYDVTGSGRSYTTSAFHLDNNHEPVAVLDAVSGEKAGNVALTYTLSDDESDTLSWVAQYSRDRGKTWLEATVSGSRTGLLPATYSGSLTWDTNTDLPGWEDSLTYFRIVPSDYEPGEPGELVLHVDNNDPPTAGFEFAADTIISRATIPYVLSDPENDTLSIQAAYSLDLGENWEASFVSLASRAIPPSAYSGSVEWVAFPSLVGTNDDVMLRLLPQDYDPGVGDTLTSLTVIYYPGDYTGDLLISTNDLAEFAAAWNATPQDLAYEIGPATGTVPDIVPQPDGVLDFEDLTVFAMMWNWSFVHHGFAKSIPVLAKAIYGSPTIRLVQRMPDDLYRWDGAILVDLFVDDTEGLMMVDGVVSYAPRSLQLIEVADGGYLNQFFKATPLLSQVSPDSSQALFALVGLGAMEPGSASWRIDDLPVATLRFRPRAHESPPLILDYTLTGIDGGAVEAGQVQFEVQNLMPKEFALHQNYPNPFNPTTTIRFELPKATKVYLVIYDILGREVARLVDGQLESGYRQVVWNGKDRYGRELASGIYIVRMFIPPSAGLTPDYTRSIKTLLLK